MGIHANTGTLLFPERYLYASEAYARSLLPADVVFVESLGIWVERRPIPGADLFDARQTYPFAPVAARPVRAALVAELAALGIVSLVFQTDPLAMPGGRLIGAFDFLRAYKTHYVIDQRYGCATFSRHHQREVRLANSRCEVREISIRENLDAWEVLYAGLILRHGLKENRQYPPGHIRALADLEHFSMVGAFREGELVSAYIWCLDQDRVYAHLGASSEAGYRLGASYAVIDHVAARFGNGVRINLGGAPDHEKTPGGLDFFKAGFANRQVQNLLCGVIADKAAYGDLCVRAGVSENNDRFFPAYRACDRVTAAT